MRSAGLQVNTQYKKERKRLMKKQVSVVLAAAIAGGLLAGCGSTKPAETTAAAGTNGAGET